MTEESWTPSYAPSETASEPQDYYLDDLPARHPSRIRGLRGVRAVSSELRVQEPEQRVNDRIARMEQVTGDLHYQKDKVVREYANLGAFEEPLPILGGKDPAPSQPKDASSAPGVASREPRALGSRAVAGVSASTGFSSTFQGPSGRKQVRGFPGRTPATFQAHSQHHHTVHSSFYNPKSPHLSLHQYSHYAHFQPTPPHPGHLIANYPTNYQPHLLQSCHSHAVSRFVNEAKMEYGQGNVPTSGYPNQNPPTPYHTQLQQRNSIPPSFPNQNMPQNIPQHPYLIGPGQPTTPHVLPYGYSPNQAPMTPQYQGQAMQTPAPLMPLTPQPQQIRPMQLVPQNQMQPVPQNQAHGVQGQVYGAQQSQSQPIPQAQVQGVQNQACVAQSIPQTQVQDAYQSQAYGVTQNQMQNLEQSLRQAVQQFQANPRALPTVPHNASSIDTVALPSEMPIGSLVHFQGPPKHGVVKIANIPYSITKQEVLQFLGRTARIVTPDFGTPVHIIMERSTGKTMDCYVEFLTPGDAQETVTRINQAYEAGRPPRLGCRPVEVELSSQDALLKELFPRAKCISWVNGMPNVMPNTDPYSTGFQGFFTSEEIVGLVRHAETPQRSPFCVKCPQRTYECTISTLYKFPWYATKLYTIDDRNMLFEAVNRQLKALVVKVRKSNTMGLDQKLLYDLLQAGLNCPAFNERQKFTLSVNSEDILEMLKFPDVGKYFPFDTLVRLPGYDEGVLMYYADLIAKGAMVSDPGSSELPNTYATHTFQLESPYGHVWFEWKKDVVKKKKWEDAVQYEMVVLTNLVLDGWIKTEREKTPKPAIQAAPSSAHGSNQASSGMRPISSILALPTQQRLAQAQSRNNGSTQSTQTQNTQNQTLLRPVLPSSSFQAHRTAMSSPSRLPPPLTPIDVNSQQGTGSVLETHERDFRQGKVPYT